MARLPNLNPDAGGDDNDSTVMRSSEADSSGRFRLVALWSGGASASLNLINKYRVTIGRGGGCDMHIDDASVSREHAALTIGDVVELEDLDSKNGTRLAGRRLAPRERVRLEVGVVAEVGDVMLVLHGPAPHHSSLSTSTNSAAGSTTSRSMEQTNRLINLVARSSISVILAGETGVGKEVLAERIHRSSARADKPFVGLNCAALPDALLESELFGYERGAFTGAVQAKTGLLEAATGGTVFLDELGEMPPATQAKLLRAIENREAMRLGGIKPRPFDVRFIAATNRDLEACVTEGAFRADLYFRLNGISIWIPPLRERRSEIVSLAEIFLKESCKRGERAVPTLSLEALRLLENHRWPGNVRELRNVIDRAVVLCAGDTVLPDHIVIQRLNMPSEAPKEAVSPAPSPPASLPQELAAIERQRIVDALERCGGNQKKAAQLLGISRRTLVYRLDTHGIARPRKGTDH